MADAGDGQPFRSDVNIDAGPKTRFGQGLQSVERDLGAATVNTSGGTALTNAFTILRDAHAVVRKIRP